MTTTVRPISIAITALGGQGGGVLSQWIVDLAEANGYVAQYTSVPGVAQRTGATIYAIELFPKAEIDRVGRQPVLALMPAAGDVDIVIASELMEAGRAVTRGLVTPDQTTLIASSHRVYAISEKVALGDGRQTEAGIRAALAAAARKLVIFDMDAVADAHSSVISAVLFGALAGSGALPIAKDGFEDTIRQSGRAVETNLAAFAAAFDRATGGGDEEAAVVPGPGPVITGGDLSTRVGALPSDVQPIVTYGLHRLVDYQDADYAGLYLDRLEDLAAAAPATVLLPAARFLALWMGFDDVIRVADLKTRGDRFDKIAEEVRAAPGQIWYAADYFHPRYEEMTDSLPLGLGRVLAGSPLLTRLLSRFFLKGRLLRAGTLSGYIILRALAGLRRFRRSTERFKRENTSIEIWLDVVKFHAGDAPALAAEIAQLPRLIKGYGDTHERGAACFARIMAYIDEKPAGADILDDVICLRVAALADDAGLAFNACLNDLQSKGSPDNVTTKGQAA